MAIIADRTYKGYKLVSTGNGWNVFTADDKRVGYTVPTLRAAKERVNEAIDFAG